MANDDDDERDHPEFNPLAAMMHHAHDRAHMVQDELNATIYALLDALSPEQLMALRKMLNFDQKSPWNNFWDGQIVSVMRLTHQVDPESGLTVVEALERATKVEP